jgi:hypothetical protein
MRKIGGLFVVILFALLLAGGVAIADDGMDSEGEIDCVNDIPSGSVDSQYCIDWFNSIPDQGPKLPYSAYTAEDFNFGPTHDNETGTDDGNDGSGSGGSGGGDSGPGDDGGQEH